MNKDIIYLNFFYLEPYKKYKINIINSKNQKISKILKDELNIENIYLEVEKRDVGKTFPINETIKVNITRNRDNNIIGTTNEAYIPIFSSKKDHYIKFSIHYRNDCHIFTISLAVYYKSLGCYNSLFQASKTINKKIIEDSSLNSYNYNDINNTNLFSQNSGVYSLDSKNIRSKSLKAPNLQFQNQLNILVDKQINYNISDIKNIPDLTRSITTKIFGLLNLGNTCFLNSSLQILIHSPIFIQNFLEDFHSFKPATNTVAYEFFNLIMNIHSINKDIFSPDKLISSFLNKCQLFRLGQQSDSQSFFRNLVTIFDKEFGPSNRCIKDTFLGKFTFRMEFSCTNPFCDFNQKNEVTQPFYDLFVATPQTESTVNNLIISKYKRQSLESSKTCPQCGWNFELNKFSKIEPNKYFSVNIQRAVNANSELNNAPIVIGNIFTKNNIYYEPYALNFHIGKTDFGHYYR